MLKSFCVALLIAVLGVCFLLIYQAYDAAEEARAELKLARSTLAKLQRENEEIAARLAAEIERARRRNDSGLESDSETLAGGPGANSRTKGSRDAVDGTSPNTTRNHQFGEEPGSTGLDGTSSEIPEEVKEAALALQEEQAKARQDRQRKWRVDRIRERVGNASNRMNLRQDQEETLVAALADHWEKREQILAKVRDSELEMAAARPLLTARRTAVESEVKAILSGSQYAEFEKIQEEDPALGVLMSEDGRVGGNAGRDAKQAPDTDEPEQQPESPEAPRR